MSDPEDASEGGFGAPRQSASTSSKRARLYSNPSSEVGLYLNHDLSHYLLEYRAKTMSYRTVSAPDRAIYTKIRPEISQGCTSPVRLSASK